MRRDKERKRDGKAALREALCDLGGTDGTKGMAEEGKRDARFKGRAKRRDDLIHQLREIHTCGVCMPRTAPGWLDCKEIHRWWEDPVSEC